MARNKCSYCDREYNRKLEQIGEYLFCNDTCFKQIVIREITKLKDWWWKNEEKVLIVK